MGQSDAGVPLGLYLKTRLVQLTRVFWPALSRLESMVLADELKTVRVNQPVYVTGIARAGTTIVTEMLSRSQHLTSHQYADFPVLLTPYWRNWLADRSEMATPAPVERAHQDRIQISVRSPEAFEEVLWMAFNRLLHRAQPITAIGPDDAPAGFKEFYLAHIRKLLLVRHRSRYLAKGNYNLLRIAWLVHHMKDPRIVLMTRDPSWHIASLMKQHQLFQKAQQLDRRISGQLAASGHFEFGPQRSAPAYQGPDAQQQVSELWAAGDEVRGWARLWAQGYSLALNYLADPTIAPHILMVRYEDLCANPDATITAIAEHCRLDNFAAIRDDYAGRLTTPDYYQPQFTNIEQEAIAEETAEVATALGYATTP